MLGVIAARLSMGKNKKRRSQQRLPQKQAMQLVSLHKRAMRWLRILSPTGWLCALISLVLTLIGSYYLFSSKLSVEADASINPKDAVQTFFRFTNQGVFPVYDVYCAIKIHHLRSADGRQNLTDSGMLPPPQNIHKLAPGEATTIKIPMLVKVDGATYSDADVEIIYSYKPFLIRRTCFERVRFTTVTEADGTVHWIHKAINE